MKCNFKKVLFGLSLSLVLAMAIGSFALSETQTPVAPLAAEPSSVTAGAFTITGESVTENTDYTFTGTTETDGVLTIISDKEMTIKNTSTGGTTDRIKVDLTSDSEANITLDGVNINTDQGAAFEIKDDATFNVNITLADKSENTLTATANNYAGLQKNGDSSVGMLTITGSTGENAGKLTATGGYYGAGIGGGDNGSGSDITISGGTVTANGGDYAAGIGGGKEGNGSDITITGGNVTATGREAGAGIGGGYMRNGRKINIINNSKVEAYGGRNAAGIGGGQADFDDSGSVRIGGNGSEINIINSTVKAVGSDADFQIQTVASAGIGGGYMGDGNKVIISNSTVIATGGSGYAFDVQGMYVEYTSAAAIGGGCGVLANGEWEANPGTGSENKIDSSSILIAKGGEDGDSYSIETLQGFDEGLKGLVFEQKTDSDVSTGTMYNNVVLKSDLTMPENATLTIPQNNSLTINAGKTLTVPDGSVLTNDGTLTIKGTLSCTGTGKVETLLNYDKQLGRTKANDDNHVLYQDATEVKKYENMPSVEKEGYDFDGWYTKEKGQGTKVEEGDDILLNEHTLYANWIAEPEPTPTPPGPEPGPEPEPTPDPSVDPDGDGSGASSKTSDPFMEGTALALLGITATGAVILRKRK